MAGEVSEGMLFDLGHADGITPVLAVPEAPVPGGTRAGSSPGTHGVESRAMYPYLRTARVLLAAQLGQSLDFDGESVVTLRIGLGDIDVFPEVNNGRHLTLMDLGRFDLAVRSGFWKTIHREGWGLTVGGASVRFRHRVPPLSRVRLRTRVVGCDDRWFYFHQKIERGSRVCSAALVRTGVTARGGLVPVERVLEATGQVGWAPELPEWVQAWIDADARRPWPAVAPDGKES